MGKMLSEKSWGVIKRLKGLGENGYLSVSDIAVIMARYDGWTFDDEFSDISELLHPKIIKRYKQQARSFMDRMIGVTPTNYKKEKIGKEVVYGLSERGKLYNLINTEMISPENYRFFPVDKLIPAMNPKALLDAIKLDDGVVKFVRHGITEKEAIYMFEVKKKITHVRYLNQH